MDKPGVPIVCGNSSGNMGDRNRTNWLTVGQLRKTPKPASHDKLCARCGPQLKKAPDFLLDLWIHNPKRAGTISLQTRAEFPVIAGQGVISKE